MSRDAEGIQTFGDWAKQRRLTLNLTQSALAKRVGCAVATLQKIEQGARTPSEQIANLLARALALAEADVPAFVAAARSGVAPRFQTAAPDLARIDDLIGRDAQLAALATLIRERRQRVISLIGPGGVGKTSLALALAHALAGEFESGARVVSLADARAHELVIGVATSALLPDSKSGSLPALLNALRGRKQLIVFDNFEHVMPAAHIVDAIARAAAGVVLLTTSREELGLRGEHVVPVIPLASADARALFERHARLAEPRWRPSLDDERAISVLCRIFDHLPLAIQLCAARVAVMPPAALLHRMLDEQGMPRIELVADGLSDLPLRHHSLDDTIRWSYALLSEPERAAFQRMAIFAGGADLAAAEALLGAPTDAWNLLTSLLQKSLLTRQPQPDGAPPRFSLLETVRVFAVRQAERDKTWTAIKDAHLRYFAGLAEANERITPFNERIAAQERDAANFYTALAHAWRTDPGVGLRLFRALLKFWRARVRFGDQLLMAEDGLAHLPHGLAATRGELLMQAGSACIALERIDAAHAYLQRASELLSADAEAVRAWLWRVRDLQGLVAQRQGDLERALALHREAVALVGTDDHGRPVLHVARAEAMLGRFEDVEITLREDRDELRADDESTVLALLLLASAQTMLGKLDDAAAALARCDALAGSFGLYDWRGAICMAHGALAYLRGDASAALAHADRARVEYAQIGDALPMLTQCDRERALLMIERGEAASGLRLLLEATSGETFADDSVAGVAVLAGLAIALEQAGQAAAARAAMARVAQAHATVDLRCRVFIDSTPTELEYSRRALQRLQIAPGTDAAPQPLRVAIAHAREMARTTDRA